MFDIIIVRDMTGAALCLHHWSKLNQSNNMFSRFKVQGLYLPFVHKPTVHAHWKSFAGSQSQQFYMNILLKIEVGNIKNNINDIKYKL